MFNCECWDFFLQPQKPTGECEALFDFKGDVLAGELSFKTGEAIVITEWVNAEWVKGCIGTRTGSFPLNFVKVTKDLPKSNSETSKSITKF